MQISQQKSKKRDSLLKSEHQGKMLLIIKYALKFIGPDGWVDYRAFIVLRRDWFLLFHRQILKQALVYGNDIEKLRRRRVIIWPKLMRVDHCTENYEENLNAAKGINGESSQKLDEKVSELIEKDMKRSFHIMRNIGENYSDGRSFHDKLTDILKTFAYCSPEIDYQQGMNFTAGFLYMYFEEEELAFKTFMRISEEFRLSDWFNRT